MLLCDHTLRTHGRRQPSLLFNTSYVHGSFTDKQTNLHVHFECNAWSPWLSLDAGLKIELATSVFASVAPRGPGEIPTSVQCSGGLQRGCSIFLKGLVHEVFILLR